MNDLRKRMLAQVALPLVLVVAPGAAVAQAPPAAAPGAGEVTIYRDKMGVPHVYADTATALFYGASYAIAHDRLAEAELEMRGILGRTAELAGPGEVDLDKKARMFLPTDASIQTQFEKLPLEDQAILKAMHQGWLAYVHEVRQDPSKLPYEFKEWGIQPTEWTLWDVLKVSSGIAKFYGTAGGRELKNLAFFRDLVARYGEAKAKMIFDDVLPLQDPDAVPFIPEGEQGSVPTPVPVLTAQQEALPLAALGPMAQAPAHRGASRALLIGSTKSATGNPIILQATADGPDLHISGAGYEAAGYVFATMSPVIQGRTKTFAWSITTGEDDMIDTYAERLNPANRRQYFYKGAWRDMTVRHEIIKVRGGAPVDLEIEETVHGPIVQREEAANVAYSVKNAMDGNELAGTAGSLELNRAKTFEDYKRAAAKFVGSSNINYAGIDKRIATIHAGWLPLRPTEVDPRLPTPGTGEYEWQGYARALPSVTNPRQGYLHVWNNKVTAETTYGDTSRYGKSFRTWLGRSLVESKDKITLEDVHEFHRQIGRSAGGEDLTVTNPRYFTPYLRRAVAGDPKLEAAVAEMESWNGLYEDKDHDGYYDSPGLTFYRKWIDTAQREIVAANIGEWWRKLDDDSYIKYRTDVLLRAIEGSDAGAPMKFDWFDGRPRDEVLRRTVADAVTALEKEYGSADPKTWRQRIFYRYYNPAAVAKNPDKPVRPESDQEGVFAYLAPGRLGLQPAYIPDNGSEDWNMLVEVKKGDPVLYDSTPSGGQNLFVSADGKGNPNIADQVQLHETFEFKAVDMDRARIERSAVSVQHLFFSRPSNGLSATDRHRSSDRCRRTHRLDGASCEASAGIQAEFSKNRCLIQPHV